jgi:hypothetical protein
MPDLDGPRGFAPFDVALALERVQMDSDAAEALDVEGLSDFPNRRREAVFLNVVHNVAQNLLLAIGKSSCHLVLQIGIFYNTFVYLSSELTPQNGRKCRSMP